MLITSTFWVCYVAVLLTLWVAKHTGSAAVSIDIGCFFESIDNPLSCNNKIQEYSALAAYINSEGKRRACNCDISPGQAHIANIIQTSSILI